MLKVSEAIARQNVAAIEPADRIQTRRRDDGARAAGFATIKHVETAEPVGPARQSLSAL